MDVVDIVMFTYPIHRKFNTYHENGGSDGDDDIDISQKTHSPQHMTPLQAQ